MIFGNLFKKQIDDKSKTLENKTFERIKLLNQFSPFLLSDVDNIYDNLIIRSCIDTVAKHCGKLKAKVKGPNSKFKNRIEYLLTHRPNRYMSAYDFLYKVVSMYLTNNNAFIFINFDYLNGIIEGLYPVPYSNIEFLQADNDLYCKFSFKSGTKPVILPYEDLIHLRRHFNNEDLAGSPQFEVLNPTLKLFKGIVESFINSFNATSRLRGYIKYVNNLNPKDLKQFKEDFISSYMQSGTDGIGALDAKADFVATKIEPYTIDNDNQETANKQIYTYYGVSEAILTGDYTEEKFNAFYNSTIEPIAIQFSDEFTNKIFSAEEIKRGCEIVFSSLRLIFANNATKMNIIKEMMPLGIFSFNDARKLFELDEIEDGDKRIVSLNYVNADKADKYQNVDDNDEGNNNGKQNPTEN